MFLMTVVFLQLGVFAQAKVTLNSMCYVLGQPGSQVQGERTEEPFEIASVSKVVTAYWAFQRLGPYFRFNTPIHVTPVGENLYDVHIQGARDPFWGRQMTHFLFSELTKKGVTRIRRLSFDEHFIFRWNVVSDFVEPSNPTPAEITKAVRRHITYLSTEYSTTRREAEARKIKMSGSVSLRVTSVVPLAKLKFAPKANTTTYQLKSAPLYRYVKEMNVVSNNHVADHIFDYLGGSEQFKRFIRQDMNMNSDDIHFVNGSGNSLIGKDDRGALVKEYNKASCSSMIRILIKMDADLKADQLEMKDVLAVSSSDQGTLSPRFDSIPNILAGKTGTVDPAITLAGVVSTAQGDVYFGIFMSTEGAGDWGTARDQVREKVFELIKSHGGHRQFAYAARKFLPFDEYSGFTGTSPSLRMP